MAHLIRELTVKQKIKMGINWTAKVIRHLYTGEDAHLMSNDRKHLFVIYEYESYELEDAYKQKDADYGEWVEAYRGRYYKDNNSLAPRGWLPKVCYPGKGKWDYNAIYKSPNIQY